MVRKIRLIPSCLQGHGLFPSPHGHEPSPLFYTTDTLPHVQKQKAPCSRCGKQNYSVRYTVRSQIVSHVIQLDEAAWPAVGFSTYLDGGGNICAYTSRMWQRRDILPTDGTAAASCANRLSKMSGARSNDLVQHGSPIVLSRLLLLGKQATSPRGTHISWELQTDRSLSFLSVYV